MHTQLSSFPRPMPSPASPSPIDRGHGVMGAGGTVVLLHSSLSSKNQWTSLAQRLAARFRVIAIDLHGYGDRDMPEAVDRFSLDDEVALVLATTAPLVTPQERMHIVGHSYGGAVALRFAERHANRVASLALYEPVAFYLLEADDPQRETVRTLADRVADLCAMKRTGDAARTFVDFWNGDGFFAALPPPVQARLALRVGKVPLDFRAVFQCPLRLEDCHAIKAPALLLEGRRSPAVTRHIVTLLGKALPDVKLDTLDGDHMAPAYANEAFNLRVERFLIAHENEGRGGRPHRVDAIAA